MMTKKLILLALFLGISSNVFAESANYSDTANVLDVKEIYRVVQMQEPYEYCSQQSVQQYYRGDGSATNELVGGILGGIIGNQLGGGSGQKITTVAGALLGASLANDGERERYQDANPGKTKEVCVTRHRYVEKERLSHYRVQYRYNGKRYTYTTKKRPISDTIRVRVSIAPVQ